MRPDPFLVHEARTKFAAKSVDQGTAVENKAVLAGLVASFGTYTVNEADKTLITRVEGNIFPNLVGTDQKRLIVSLTPDELKYTNPSTSTGTTAEATWRRIK
jgi:lipocalin-like protein